MLLLRMHPVHAVHPVQESSRVTGYVAPLTPAVLPGHERVKTVWALLKAAGGSSPLLSVGAVKTTRRRWQAAAEIYRQH